VVIECFELVIECFKDDDGVFRGVYGVRTIIECLEVIIKC